MATTCSAGTRYFQSGLLNKWNRRETSSSLSLEMFPSTCLSIPWRGTNNRSYLNHSTKNKKCSFWKRKEHWQNWGRHWQLVPSTRWQSGVFFFGSNVWSGSRRTKYQKMVVGRDVGGGIQFNFCFYRSENSAGPMPGTFFTAPPPKLFPCQRLQLFVFVSCHQNEMQASFYRGSWWISWRGRRSNSTNRTAAGCIGRCEWISTTPDCLWWSSWACSRRLRRLVPGKKETNIFKKIRFERNARRTS